MIIDMQEAIKNKTAHPDDTPADVKIAIKDLNLYYGSSGRPAAANRRC